MIKVPSFNFGISQPRVSKKEENERDVNESWSACSDYASTFNGPSQKSALQRKNPIYVLPKKELGRLSPNVHIYVSVCDLYIPRMACNRIGRPIVGIYKYLTDTCMWKLGLRPRNSLPENSFQSFGIVSFCSAGRTTYCPCRLSSLPHFSLPSPRPSSSFFSFCWFVRVIGYWQKNIASSWPHVGFCSR
jgi:hypothetical protein